MRPALYVEIDCDLYSSTSLALEWLLANRLIVPGTLLGYDDLVSGGRGGEARAHREMVARHGLRLRSVPCEPRPCTPLVYQVQGLRGMSSR